MSGELSYEEIMAEADFYQTLPTLYGNQTGSFNTSETDPANDEAEKNDLYGAIDTAGEDELNGKNDYTGEEGSSGFGVGSLLKFADTKTGQGLMQSLLTGVAGAYKDKNAREMSQAQLDAIKQRQTDLNNSVPKFGNTIHGKNYKG